MTIIAGTLLLNGIKYVEEIRTALMGGAYLFTFAGFIEGAWLAGEDMKNHLLNIIKVALVAAFVAGFPTIIQKGDESLAKLHTSIAERQEDAFKRELKIHSTEPSWTDIAGRISYSIGTCLQSFGLLGYQFVYWAKDISILLLISVSPLLIGFLAFSYTRSIGINFLITSVTIVLWNIGFAIVDTLLVILGDIIMPVMGAGTVGAVGVLGSAGAVAVTAGPQFLVLCLVAATLPIFMYVSVPIITGAIMKGTNIAGATISSYNMAHKAFHHAGAGHGARWGSSASSQQGRGMTFQPPAALFQSAGGESGHGGNDEGGASSFYGGAPTKGPRGPFASGSSKNSSSSGAHAHEEGFMKKDAMAFSGIPSSEGIPTGSPLGSVGSSIVSPDRSMTATQCGDGLISVRDNQGRFSSRPGSVADSVTVAAAFNSHEGTAISSMASIPSPSSSISSSTPNSPTRP